MGLPLPWIGFCRPDPLSLAAEPGHCACCWQFWLLTSAGHSVPFQSHTTATVSFHSPLKPLQAHALPTEAPQSCSPEEFKSWRVPPNSGFSTSDFSESPVMWFSITPWLKRGSGEINKQDLETEDPEASTNPHLTWVPESWQLGRRSNARIKPSRPAQIIHDTFWGSGKTQVSPAFWKSTLCHWLSWKTQQCLVWPTNKSEDVCFYEKERKRGNKCSTCTAPRELSGPQALSRAPESPSQHQATRYLNGVVDIWALPPFMWCVFWRCV